MFAFFTSIFLLAAGGGGESGFTRFYNEWFNIPGFELWKFINLAIFVAVLFYLLKKPLGAAFRAKRDEIRAELIKAEQEKQAAMARLTVAEGRVAQLETERENIIARARAEAEDEKRRISEQTTVDVERLNQQIESDLSRLANQTRAELRRLAAEESVRRAETKLRSTIDDVSNARLVKASIREIGGLN